MGLAERLQGLIDVCNDTTGEADDNLTDAINSLVNAAGSFVVGWFTGSNSKNVTIPGIGNFDNFVIMAAGSSKTSLTSGVISLTKDATAGKNTLFNASSSGISITSANSTASASYQPFSVNGNLLTTKTGNFVTSANVSKYFYIMWN